MARRKKNISQYFFSLKITALWLFWKTYHRILRFITAYFGITLWKQQESSKKKRRKDANKQHKQQANKQQTKKNKKKQQTQQKQTTNKQNKENVTVHHGSANSMPTQQHPTRPIPKSSPQEFPRQWIQSGPSVWKRGRRRRLSNGKKKNGEENKNKFRKPVFIPNNRWGATLILGLQASCRGRGCQTIEQSTALCPFCPIGRSRMHVQFQTKFPLLSGLARRQSAGDHEKTRMIRLSLSFHHLWSTNLCER